MRWGYHALRGLAVVTAAVPAFAFLLGGIGKLHDPFLSARFVARAFWMPLDAGFPVVRAVAVLELLLALPLCILNGRSRVPAYIGLCLLAFFIGLLVSVIAGDAQAVSCGCFGSLMGEGLKRRLWSQVYIDLGLALLLIGNLLLAALLRRTEARQHLEGLAGRR
jgi:hypothetical protein